MKKNKVTIGGKEYAVGFSMGVAIDWERRTGKGFAPGECLKTLDGQLGLCHAALSHYNPGRVADFAEWVDSLTFSESAALQEAVADCLSDFYTLPADEAAEDDAAEGGAEKNA